MAETQILAGLEVMLILLDICKHFYQLVGYLLDICQIFVGYLLILLDICKHFYQLLLSEGYILFILSVHGSEKLSVKFSQKKLGRGLKIILHQPLQIPLPKNYPCMRDVCWFCTDLFYSVTRSKDFTNFPNPVFLGLW